MSTISDILEIQKINELVGHWDHLNQMEVLSFMDSIYKHLDISFWTYKESLFP